MCIQWLLYTSHKYCCLPNVYFDHLAYVLNDFCTLVISTCLGGRWWPDYFMISGGTISCFLIQHVDKIILYFMFQHLMTVWGSYLLTLRPFFVDILLEYIFLFCFSTFFCFSFCFSIFVISMFHHLLCFLESGHFSKNVWKNSENIFYFPSFFSDL